jgi:hypothetical protein
MVASSTGINARFEIGAGVFVADIVDVGVLVAVLVGVIVAVLVGV